MSAPRLWTALNLVRWVAPPLAFAVWGVRFLEELLDPAVPAFGSMDAHLALHRLEVLRSGGTGALIAAVWAVAWTGLFGFARTRGRRRRRPDAGEAVRSPFAD